MRIFGKNIFGKSNQRIEGAATNQSGGDDISLNREFGRSGTNILDGIITEEYNKDLEGRQGVEKYDEMRKSDGTVRAVLQATKLPIRRANWFIEPGGQTSRDEEIADFTHSALFDWQTITWDDLLRQVLLNMDFGVSVFEKVFTVKGDRIIWKKLAPRLPQSIYKWETNDHRKGITQLLPNGGMPSIPIDKLLVFINEPEGDNWWGTSLLRYAHKHWYFKNTFYQLQAISYERQGVGVPTGTLPPNYTEKDRTELEKILKNMRADEKGYVIKPPGYEIEFMDMGGNTVKEPKEAIGHHNREIAQSVLAQFLELGSGETGSYALSEDQSTLFLESVEAHANQIVDVFNKYAIPQLIDLNFSNVENYPKLQYSGIARKDIKKLAETYAILRKANGLSGTKGDEQYWRQIMDLPENEDPDTEDTAPAPNDSNPNDDTETDEKATNFTEPADKKKEFQEGEFNPWRPLTFAEKKVDLRMLNQRIDELQENLREDLEKILQKEKQEFEKRVSEAFLQDDLEGVNNAAMRAKTKYKQTIKDYMHDSFNLGKETVANEMSKDTPPTPKHISRNIDIIAGSIASKHMSEIAGEAKMRAAQAIAAGDNKTKTLGDMSEKMDEMIDNLNRHTSDIAVAGFINNGRRETMERNMDDIFALQRSEILDRRTCNFCLSVDGRVVEKDDPFAKNTIFHTGCRGIWVEILKDEQEKPKVEGVPKKVRDRFGDAINDLIQPKKPITRKDSLARKFLKKEDRDTDSS